MLRDHGSPALPQSPSLLADFGKLDLGVLHLSFVSQAGNFEALKLTLESDC